jgi:hypothetical protein
LLLRFAIYTKTAYPEGSGVRHIINTETFAMQFRSSKDRLNTSMEVFALEGVDVGKIRKLMISNPIAPL